MHELNICLHLIRIAEQNAAPSVARIKTIWLEIGALAGVDVDAIRFSFPIAAAHTLAKNATLEIKTQEGLAWCLTCQKNVTIASLFTPSAICNQYDYHLTQGKALRIIQMQVE